MTMAANQNKFFELCLRNSWVPTSCPLGINASFNKRRRPLETFTFRSNRWMSASLNPCEASLFDSDFNGLGNRGSWFFNFSKRDWCWLPAEIVLNSLLSIRFWVFDELLPLTQFNVARIHSFSLSVDETEIRSDLAESSLSVHSNFVNLFRDTISSISATNQSLCFSFRWVHSTYRAWLTA